MTRRRGILIVLFVLLFLYAFGKVMINVGYYACERERAAAIKEHNEAVGCLSWSPSGHCMQYPMPTERKKRVRHARS